MSTVDEPPAIAEAAISTSKSLVPYLVTAEVFGRMLDAEVFADEDRVELWDGRINEKMAKTQAHAVSGNLTHLALVRILPGGWFPGGENPVTLNQTRLPLPDLVVLRGNPKDYIDRRPAPEDVGLIVEFALSSLKSDTGTKLAGYAEANVPVYWVINLIKNVIQVFERPVPAERRYEMTQTFAVGQAVPLRLDGVLVAEIPALDLLPIRG